MTFPDPSVHPGDRIKLMAIPLIIDDCAHVRVVSSGLQLHNREVVEESIRRNREQKDLRQKESRRALHEESVIGAEFITRRRHSTRTVKLDEIAKHYKPNEHAHE